MNIKSLVENVIRPPQKGHAEGPDNMVAEPGTRGGTGAVRIGELKTLGGYVYQWDGTRWYNTGVRDVPEPKAAGAPEIEYDARGRAFRWTTINGMPVTAYLGEQFDRADKAVGYRAPTQAAPRYPTTEVNRQTGDIFTVDPYSGLPTWVGNDPRFVTEPTPGQQRANTLADLEAQRRFTSGENEATRRFTAGENEATRRASAEEAGLNRALNAGQFAASLQAARQRDEMAAEESYQNRVRQYGQDQIAGARTVAELTNTVDPTALPAFYRAGGGNIGNAIAAGASAVSDRAVLPAAQALRGTREMARPTRFTFAPLSLPAPVAPPVVQPRYSPAPVAVPAPAPVTEEYTPPNASGLGNTAPVSQAEYGTKTGGGFANVSPEQYALIPEQFKRYAFGTQGKPATGTFIAGDDADPSDPFANGADPEMVTVEDPPGPNNARAHVMPMEKPGSPEGGGGMAKFGAVLRAIAEMLTGTSQDEPGTGAMPRYALGTGTAPYDPYALTQPGDEPYMNEIRDIRTTAPYAELNPYSTKYRFISPTVRASFLAGRQGRYGVPVLDQQAQIDQYEIPTGRRGAFQLGV